MKEAGREIAPVADWDTKRRWVGELFESLELDGYRVGSGYTASRGADTKFLYRDGLWHGADLLGLGVASFSHVGGTHFQNVHDFDPYIECVESGELPVHRGLRLTDEERLIREFVLQLKLGKLDTRALSQKFETDVIERFRTQLERHERDGYLSIEEQTITLSRRGLLQVDTLLDPFFLEQHRAVRYA